MWSVDRSQPALLKSIEELSESHAAVGNLHVVDHEHDVERVPGFLAGDRSLFVAAGTVDAYVDFGGLADGDLTLSVDGKTATIRWPEPELDEPNLDQDRTYLFSEVARGPPRFCTSSVSHYCIQVADDYNEEHASR